jgi:hypothetical protein
MFLNRRKQRKPSLSSAEGVSSQIRLNHGVARLLFKPSLLLLSFQLSAFIPIPSAFAQAPGYSREEIIARDQEQPEGIVANESSDSAGRAGNELMSLGATGFSSTRAGVRDSSTSRSAMLTYDQHREIEPPSDATLRIGPLYSNIGISQSVGYRYIKMEGSGVDFLTGNRRGQFLRDGSDFPLETTLTLDNYLIVTRHMDLEMNIDASYMYYPLETQEDDLRVDLTDEGVFGTLSSELQLSRNTRLLLYEDILYRTDYVDTRGLSDSYGGEAYEYLENTVGADWDWKPSNFDNVSLSASRRDTIPLDNAFTNQEGVVYSEVASYQRQLTRFSTAGLLGNFSQSLYDLESRSDIYMSGVSAFAAARLTRKVTGNVSLGYQTSTYEGGSSDGNRSGLVTARLGLAHEISEKQTQTLTCQRSQIEAFSGGVNVNQRAKYEFSWTETLFPGSFSTLYSASKPEESTRNGYTDWTTMLTLRHQLTRLLELAFTTRYAIRKNEASSLETVADTADLNSDYETLSVRLGTGCALTRKTRFETYIEHAERMSENENLAYTRDVFAITLTWAHDF